MTNSTPHLFFNPVWKNFFDPPTSSLDPPLTKNLDPHLHFDNSITGYHKIATSYSNILEIIHSYYAYLPIHRPIKIFVYYQEMTHHTSFPTLYRSNL